MQKFEDRIQEVCERLGIPSDYESRYGLSIQYEETSLVGIGEDIFKRQQFLSKSAAQSWRKMKQEAQEEGVQLDIVSAFRSVDRQQSIIQSKLEQGQRLEHILKVSAAPGYSEHHTGRAIDIVTPGCSPLEENFEQSDAFAWLVQNAADYAYSLSYPKDNPSGIAYEPWHWGYSSKTVR